MELLQKFTLIKTITFLYTTRGFDGNRNNPFLSLKIQPRPASSSSCYQIARKLLYPRVCASVRPPVCPSVYI